MNGRARVIFGPIMVEKKVVFKLDEAVGRSWWRNLGDQNVQVDLNGSGNLPE